MRSIVVTSCVAAVLLACASLAQAQTVLGDSVSGFRGNLTGSWPDSKAPASWGRISTLMAGARSQIDKPADDKPAGDSASVGTLPQWLVIGGFEPKDADKPQGSVEEAFINETEAQPSEGDKVGQHTWKKAASLGCYVDFEAAFPDPKPKEGSTCYAHAYIYLEQAGSVMLRFGTLPTLDAKAWVNGKLVFQATKWRYWNESQFAQKVELNKGWNRLLVKVIRGKKAICYISSWQLSFFFYAATPQFDKSTNIAWISKIPGDGCVSNPIVVGDKIITESDPFDVVCLSKKDGKLLWIRSASYYDTLPDEEKNSPAFKELAPLAKRIEEINTSLCGKFDQALVDEKMKAQDQIIQAMRKADPKRFDDVFVLGHPGWCAPNPVSDGKQVYVFMATGVVAAFDLEGHRKWIRYEKSAPCSEHGNNASPALVDGKVIIYDGAPRNTVAFDAITGKMAWRRDWKDLKKEYKTYTSDHFMSGPSNSAAPLIIKIKDTPVVLLQSIAFRAADGKVVWAPEPQDKMQNNVTTAVIEDGKLYAVDDGCGGRNLTVCKVPTAFESDGTLKMEKLGSMAVLGNGVQSTGECVCGSPLVHKGLVYLVDMIGRVQVVDARDPAKMTVLYKQRYYFPDNRAPIYHMGSSYASPILFGSTISVQSHTGTFLTFAAGPEFKLLSINRLENHLPMTRQFAYCQHPEIFNGAPVVDGDRIYVRGDENLYCVGKQ